MKDLLLLEATCKLFNSNYNLKTIVLYMMGLENR